jgi:hypothetical protein
MLTRIGSPARNEAMSWHLAEWSGGSNNIAATKIALEILSMGVLSKGPELRSGQATAANARPESRNEPRAPTLFRVVRKRS